MPIPRTLSDMRQWHFFFKSPSWCRRFIKLVQIDVSLQNGWICKAKSFYYATCTTLAILIFQGICVLVMKSRKLKIRYLNLNFSMTCRNDRTFARVYLLCFAQEEIFNRNALMFQQNKYLWSLVLDFLSDFLSFLYCRKYIFSYKWVMLCELTF